MTVLPAVYHNRSLVSGVAVLPAVYHSRSLVSGVYLLPDDADQVKEGVRVVGAAEIWPLDVVNLLHRSYLVRLHNNQGTVACPPPTQQAGYSHMLAACTTRQHGTATCRPPTQQAGYNTKTTQVFDNVGQGVVEYEILNEFAERVQNSILDTTTGWSTLIIKHKHECYFCFITLFEKLL